MQPGPPPDPSASQHPPAAGWPPTPGQRAPEFAAPGGPPITPPGGSVEPTQTRREHAGLIALVAVLIEIVVIGAAANQSVSRRVSEAIFRNADTASFDWGRTLLTYQWRFSPLPTDTFHATYGQFALIGVTLVGTFVLVLAAARGGAGFWRVFAATWAAVIASTGLGAVARGLVVDQSLVAAQNKNKLRFALFDTFGPSQAVFVAGLVLGFVVAITAGLTAMLGNRRAATPPVAAFLPPQQQAGPPPAQHFGGPPPGAMPPPPPADVTREFRRPDDANATQQYPPMREPERTQQFDRPGPDERTQQFDRPGPDERTQQLPVTENRQTSDAPDEPVRRDLPDDPDATRG